VRKQVTPSLPDYTALAELRYQIRRFLHFSELAARKMGLEPQQHQLMLALKGLAPGMPPTVGTLAERMQIRHHSAVELVNRLSVRGLVRRIRAGEDRRQVLLSLTPKGEKLLGELSVGHKTELRTQGPALVAALERLMRPARKSRRVIATRSSAERSNAERSRRKLSSAETKAKNSRKAVSA
jgi:DNA-binding MarR family transcriptional regulator